MFAQECVDTVLNATAVDKSSFCRFIYAGVHSYGNQERGEVFVILKITIFSLERVLLSQMQTLSTEQKQIILLGV